MRQLDLARSPGLCQAIGLPSGPGIESRPCAAFHRATYPSSSFRDLGSPSSVKKEATWLSKP